MPLDQRTKLALEIRDQAVSWNMAGHEFRLHKCFPGIPRSPLKFELGRSTCPTGSLFSQLCGLLISEIKRRNLHFGSVVGIPNAGNLFAQELGKKGDWPLLKLEKTAAQNGEQAMRLSNEHGEFPKKDVTLVAENVVTSGGSLELGIKVLQEEGFQIHHAVTFVDWSIGGCVQIQERTGVKVIPLYTALDLLMIWKEYDRTEGNLNRLPMYEAALHFIREARMILSLTRGDP